MINICHDNYISWCMILSGGDIRLNGEERKGGIYLGADAIMFGQKGLYQNSDNQQKNQHKIL